MVGDEVNVGVNVAVDVNVAEGVSVAVVLAVEVIVSDAMVIAVGVFEGTTSEVAVEVTGDVGKEDQRNANKIIPPATKTIPYLRSEDGTEITAFLNGVTTGGWPV